MEYSITSEGKKGPPFGNDSGNVHIGLLNVERVRCIRCCIEASEEEQESMRTKNKSQYFYVHLNVKGQ